MAHDGRTPHGVRPCVLALARSPAPRQRVPGDVADLYARTLMSIFRFCLPAALCLALGKTCAAEPDAITLHVRGAAELAPRLQAAAERYMTLHRRASVVIVRGGSVFALKSLLHESADVAMVYGPPPLVMREALRERRNSLDSVLIEQLPLTPVVHPGNPLREIRLDHLRAIFAGDIQDWRVLGGPAGPMTPLVETPTYGVGLAWKEAMVGERGRLARSARLITAEDKAKEVARTPGAISFAAPWQLSPGLKPLRIVADTTGQARLPSAALSAWIWRDSPPAVHAFVKTLRAGRGES